MVRSELGLVGERQVLKIHRKFLENKPETGVTSKNLSGKWSRRRGRGGGDTLLAWHALQQDWPLCREHAPTEHAFTHWPGVYVRPEQLSKDWGEKQQDCMERTLLCLKD